MAGSKPTADEVQDQVDAPEVEDQSNDTAANLESSDLSFDDVEDDGKIYGEDENSDTDEILDDDGSDDSFDEEADGDSEDTDEQKVESEDEANPEKPRNEMSDAERKEHDRVQAEQRLQARESAKIQRDQIVEAKKQEYIDQAENEEQATARAMEVEMYDSRVERNTTRLVTASDRAFADFPILNEKDPAIQRRVNAALDAFQAQHVKIDAFGNPTKITGDLYTFLKEEADSIGELTGRGARQQAQSKDREKSKTFTPPVRRPKQKKSDPMMAAFEDEARR